MPSSLAKRSTARAALGASVACAALAWGATSSASTATFFPKGSSATVARQHVTVAVGASATVTWTTIDVGGDATDFGFIVAVKAGGRVEIAASAWIDVVEQATAVVVSTVSGGECKPLGVTGNVGASGEAGASGSASGDTSGGCGGSGGGSVDIDGGGGGGCWSRTSDKGGCNGCGSCTPSEEGHPGCSGLSSCAPASEGSSGGGSSGSSGGFDSGPGTTLQVGPYELVRVHAADGSAAAWVDGNGYDPGLSLAQSLTAVEGAGYDLYAVRVRAPTPTSAIRSLRFVTTSPSPSFPLRMLRTGATSRVPSQPVTLVVLAGKQQQLTGVPLLRVDTSQLTSKNYESLVSSLLGSTDAGDAGAGTRFVVEDARTLVNRRSGDAGDASTVADEFHARCEASRETDTVCGSSLDGGGDAAIFDAGADADASAEAGANDAGASDAGEPDASMPGCTDVDRAACDDVDLAIATGGTAVATRFRAVLSGDPASVADLLFAEAAAADALGEGVFTVRDDGVAGLCEPVAGSASVSVGASGVGEATCRQTRATTRSFGLPQLGPLVIVLAAIRAVALVMRRARRRRK